jgi:hypothetical protein
MNKTVLTIMAMSLSLVACERDADVASKNLSNDADNFKIPRRVVFYNGITDKYMLEIQGLCAIAAGSSSRSITVTCKQSDAKYKKHILGLSDNVTYFVEQLDAANVSTSFYKVTFKPSVILPDIELR